MGEREAEGLGAGGPQRGEALPAMIGEAELARPSAARANAALDKRAGIVTAKAPAEIVASPESAEHIGRCIRVGEGTMPAAARGRERRASRAARRAYPRARVAHRPWRIASALNGAVWREAAHQRAGLAATLRAPSRMALALLAMKRAPSRHAVRIAARAALLVWKGERSKFSRMRTGGTHPQHT